MEAKELKPDDLVYYVPLHVRTNDKGNLKHPDVEAGVVLEVNSASDIVFVRFGQDVNAKACYPRDLVRREEKPVGDAKTTTTTPAGTGPANSSTQG